ncbi:hypothetical protein BH09MYX1_BH09MYX1_23010 [soil metagenome]
MRTHHVIGGGTFFHVRPHFSLAAPAFGRTARKLHELLREALPDDACTLHLTKMAGAADGPDTNADVARLIDAIVADASSRIVVLNAALCDFEGHVVLDGEATTSGKAEPRLRTSDGVLTLRLTPAEKVLARVRAVRKDLLLVAFKATAGAKPEAQYEAGLSLLKRSHANLVLANDVRTGHHMVIAPELARYHEGTDRDGALRGLVAMAAARRNLSFTRTTVVPGTLVPWTSPAVPSSLRAVVDHCIARGGYLPFDGVTVGHFAYQSGMTELTSSRRKRNFNLVGERDLVRVDFAARDAIVAHGAKPSAGARSQWEVLSAFPDFDCIVHVHCPARDGSSVPRRSQRELECGSHQCGENTRNGMKRFGDLAAVMLDRHGPNVVFHRSIDPARVIAFLEAQFDLTKRSDDFAAINAPR